MSRGLDTVYRSVLGFRGFLRVEVKVLVVLTTVYNYF